jgi:Cu+-exporting ATPase
LTYGEPTLTDRFSAPDVDDALALQSAASMERYSNHPLAKPILEAAAREQLVLLDASAVRERPGEGLEGEVDGRRVRIIGSRQAEAAGYGSTLPPCQQASNA